MHGEGHGEGILIGLFNSKSTAILLGLFNSTFLVGLFNSTFLVGLFNSTSAGSLQICTLANAALIFALSYYYSTLLDRSSVSTLVIFYDIW